MDKLKKSRRPFRAQLTKVIGEAEAERTNENPDRNRLRIQMDQMEKTWYKLQEWDDKIRDQMIEDNVDDDDIDKEFEEIRKYEGKFMAMRLILDKICNELPPRPHSPTASEASANTFNTATIGRRQVQLPKIELQKFNGELKEWLGFWSQFRKIHEDPDMDGCDKLHYLQQSMTPGTTAHQLVFSYPQTSANYAKVVEALEARYGNEDTLLQVYVRELLKLVITNSKAKDKIPLESLVLQLDCHLRALETLNLAQADPATWLYPLVESSIPEETLLTWQRSPLSEKDGSQEDPPKNRLAILMEFLTKEVAIKQKIQLAQSGFQDEASVKPKPNKSKKEDIPTLAGFHIADSVCVFCGKSHPSQDCFLAMKMSVEEKRQKLSEKNACFICLKVGHRANKCRAMVRCVTCGRKHYGIMCNPEWKISKSQQQAQTHTKDADSRPNSVQFGEEQPSSGGQGKSILRKCCDSSSNDTQHYNEMTNQVCTSAVKLMTIMVNICANGIKKKVRAFLDSGSQRSYILESTAEEVGLKPVGQESVIHSLFGATKTKPKMHQKYKVTLQRLGGGFEVAMVLRGNTRISSPIPRISRDPRLFDQLKAKHIYVNDVGNDLPEIEILIGGDKLGRLLTGQLHQLDGGITAQETGFGWVLSGESHDEDTEENTVNMMILSMTATDATLENMWSLETIGIQDDADKKSSLELEAEIKENFMKTISRKPDGRYCVELPWKEDHPPLPTNKEVVFKRLERTTRKLMEANKFDQYDALLKSWTNEFTEEVPASEIQESCHYVPHRPVFKESLTTPVRPVFDCSCHVGKSPSVNDCLHTGTNYVLKIPDLILRFRRKKIGFTADIRKAFQMIEIALEHRNYLRFLWWEDIGQKILKEYRHARLPFGATCSPFILGAVLEFHLKNVSLPDREVALRLLAGFYVDNYVDSEDTLEGYYHIKEKATCLLADAKMDLRMWLSNIDGFEDVATHTVSVLGIQWDRKEDSLFVPTRSINKPEVLTKRALLSTIQKIFDPLGFLAPALIPMKMILQKTWINQMKWDEQLPYDEGNAFSKWFQQLPYLQEIRIPRLATAGEMDKGKWSLHTFTDASSCAYGSSVFLRVETGSGISVQMLMSKARVAPIKKMTIPRLELMGCLIGSRLATTVKEALKLEGITETYWSDSTTALAWIKRDYNNGVFVRNRVREIRQKTKKEDWRHVPGKLNSADLPSRGCSPFELLTSRWWEGPEFLKNPASTWPSNTYEEDEQAIMAEVKAVTETTACFLDEARRDYTFAQSVRIMGWVKRFIKNAKQEKQLTEKLTSKELYEAELAVLKEVQEEAISNPEDFKTLKVFKDASGILRVKTRLLLREDLASFKAPILLPSKHALVSKIIKEAHEKNCHAGTNFLLAHLREKYWIVHCRKSIKKVIDKCFRCRRYSAKAVVVDEGPLPEDRVKDAEAFQATGVDLAGPLILKNGSKVWIIIYTCAVYRAVRLDLVTSLSTQAFISSLRRFVDRHGRPEAIYSDNGTNFVGACNKFKQLDWNTIKKEEDTRPIQWKFNPPSAAWWGGFWERLIRSVKDLLRKTLGKASVTHSELHILLKKVEEVVNGRPLTYLSESPDDLEPLTPEMFLRTPARSMCPEITMTDGEIMRVRHKYMAIMKEELRKRFRHEYLALLKCMPKKNTRPLEVGEIVFIGSDQHKRLEWQLGRVLEFFPGKDGVSRVARLKTAAGELIRPVQRLHPLEADIKIAEKIRTRIGREVKVPDRLGVSGI